MKILALDPGYDRLGVAVLSGSGAAPVLEHSSCVTSDPDTPMVARLGEIGRALEGIIESHNPDAVALETLFFNKNVKTGIGVAQVRGIILYLASKIGARVFELSPQEVKVAVTGYGKSDKQAVIAMVRRLVPTAPKEAHDDEYDAIAVGITALAHNRG